MTYPSCAGCGSTLPQPDAAPLPFWKRTLGAFLWITVIALSISGLVVAAGLVTTPTDNTIQLLVYGNASRRVTLHQTIVIKLTVDANGETSRQQSAPLRNVKMRLSRPLFKKLAFVSLDPKPDLMTSTKGGRYFHYDLMPRDKPIYLRLYALQPGKHRVQADFYASDYLSGAYSVSIAVVPSL